MFTWTFLIISIPCCFCGSKILVSFSIMSTRYNRCISDRVIHGQYTLCRKIVRNNFIPSIGLTIPPILRWRYVTRGRVSDRVNHIPRSTNGKDGSRALLFATFQTRRSSPNCCLLCWLQKDAIPPYLFSPDEPQHRRNVSSFPCEPHVGIKCFSSLLQLNAALIVILTLTLSA